MPQQMTLNFQKRARRRRTFGAAYEPKIDAKRLVNQHARIKTFMLEHSWCTLAELAGILDYPEGSISAQIRHLKKPQFGSYKVEKRRRNSEGGTWEYRVRKEK